MHKLKFYHRKRFDITDRHNVHYLLILFLFYIHLWKYQLYAIELIAIMRILLLILSFRTQEIDLIRNGRYNQHCNTVNFVNKN